MEELIKFIENRQISQATKKMYLSVLNQFKKYYQGDFKDPKKVIEAMSNLKITTQHKLISLLKTYRPNEQKYIEIFEKSVKENNEKPQKEIPEFNLEELKQKISEITSPEYKLLYTILVNHPVLRASDYYSLSIKKRSKNYNYIQTNGKLVFNYASKVPLKEPIKLQLSPEIAKMCKKILPKIRKERDTLFEGSIQSFTRRTLKYNEFLGLPGGISIFRKLTSNTKFTKDEIDATKRLIDVAENQNHSISTLLKFYTK